MNPADWLSQIHGARDVVGVSAAQYPDAVILAFIDVESDGDPEAHRSGSQFYGLLQMGKAAGLDVDVVPSSLNGEDGNPDSEDDIEAFLELCERYADRHEYDPVRIAVLWKGGAGTAKTVGRRLAGGVDLTSAIAHAEAAHKVPNLRAYVGRFKRALATWAAWVDEQNSDHGICANEVLDD